MRADVSWARTESHKSPKAIVIDWYLVCSHGVWIVGLSVVLSSVSLNHWMVDKSRQLTRSRRPSLASRLDWHVGLAITATGFAMLPGTTVLERVGWGAVAGGSVLWGRNARVAQAERSRNRESGGVDGHDS